MRAKYLLAASVLGLALAVLVLVGVTGRAQGGQQDPDGDVGILEAGTTTSDDEKGAGLEGPSGDSHVGPEGPPLIGPGPSSEEEVDLTEGVAPKASLFFRRIAGLSFHPIDTNSTYEYGLRGCIYRTSSVGFFASDLQVPDGAIIDYLWVYFYDIDESNNAGVELYAYDGAGNYTQIATATGSGIPGYDSVGSGDFSHTVNNSAEALAVVLNFHGANSSALKICGIRIRYQLDLSQINLPLVLRQAQP